MVGVEMEGCGCCQSWGCGGGDEDRGAQPNQATEGTEQSRAGSLRAGRVCLASQGSLEGPGGEKQGGHILQLAPRSLG